MRGALDENQCHGVADAEYLFSRHDARHHHGIGGPAGCSPDFERASAWRLAAEHVGSFLDGLVEGSSLAGRSGDDGAVTIEA